MEKEVPANASSTYDYFDGCSTMFMDEVFRALETYIEEGATVVEQKLHESHGGPSMSLSQADTIREEVAKYMDEVKSAFVKNFDKFELYTIRNVFVAPDNISEIQRKYQEHQDAQNTELSQWNEIDPMDIETELNTLRQRIYTASQKQAALHGTKNELDKQISGIDRLVTDLNFTQSIPQAVRTLGEQIESTSALRYAIGRMKDLKSQLDSKTTSLGDLDELNYDNVSARFHKQLLHVPAEDVAHLNNLFRSNEHVHIN